MPYGRRRSFDAARHSVQFACCLGAVLARRCFFASFVPLPTVFFPLLVSFVLLLVSAFLKPLVSASQVQLTFAFPILLTSLFPIFLAQPFASSHVAIEHGPDSL